MEWCQNAQIWNRPQEKPFLLLYNSFKRSKPYNVCFQTFLISVLKSEVDDLRILLSSADKQLEALQREKREETIETGRKYAALETKVYVL